MKLMLTIRDVLMGLILFLITVFLVSCGTAAPPATAFDPNLNAIQQQMTAEAAQNQAQLYSAMATGTAQAPIIAITEQAAQLSFSMTQNSINKTEIAALWTPTNTPVPTITPSPTPNVPATGTNVALVAIQTKSALDLQKQQTNNYFWAALPVFVFALSMLGIAYGLITYSRERRRKPIPRDEIGKTQPILDIVTGRYVDQNANPNYFDQDMSILKEMFIQWLMKKYGFEPHMPRVTVERQDLVKEREQVIEIERVRRARLPKIDSTAMRFLPEPAEEAPDMQAVELPLPEWKIINGWDGQSRPLGLGRTGIIVAQAASPHLLTTGGTGSGKTAFMLRTQATISLAKGYQVINLGFSNSGFGVFENHPNFYSIQLNESADVIDCLASMYKELKERKEIIGGAAIEWEHWHNGQKPPRPFVDVLIDELGNLADDIYTSEESSKEGVVRTRMLWRWMSMIAKEGRKVGIRFLAALQDPTAKSVDLSFRRNCTLVSFQLGDSSQSRSFIGTAGAELLQVGHFMTRNFTGSEGIVIGGGFSPSDDEIRSYLNRSAVTQTPPPNWIEGTLKQTALPMREPVQLSATTTTEFVNGLQEWEVKVLDLYQAGLDQAAIVEAVFEPGDVVGPAAVADLINRWRVVKGATAPQVDKPADSLSEWVSTITDQKELRTLELCQQGGMSDTQIAISAYGYANNTSLAKVRKMIERYRELKGIPKDTTTTTTTTTTGPNLPDLGAVPA